MFDAMGMALAHGIGAANAAPDQLTVVVTGDGCFMLGDMSEFNTAVRYGLDMTVVILNDGAYGTEHVQFASRGMDPSIPRFDWSEFVPLAEALGSASVAVRSLSEFLKNRRREVCYFDLVQET